MSRWLAMVLAIVAVVLAAGIVIGARYAMGGASSAATLRGAGASNVRPAAIVKGRLFAAAVNAYSAQRHYAMRLRAVHCAKDPGSYACSFWQTPRRVCRFVRFRFVHGVIQVHLAGLVPDTFCQPMAGVR